MTDPLWTRRVVFVTDRGLQVPSPGTIILHTSPFMTDALPEGWGNEPLLVDLWTPVPPGLPVGPTIEATINNYRQWSDPMPVNDRAALVLYADRIGAGHPERPEQWFTWTDGRVIIWQEFARAVIWVEKDHYAYTDFHVTWKDTSAVSGVTI